MNAMTHDEYKQKYDGIYGKPINMGPGERKRQIPEDVVSMSPRIPFSGPVFDKIKNKEEAIALVSQHKSLLRWEIEGEDVDKPLSRLSRKLSKDPELMMSLIKIHPRAYLYAHKSIVTPYFIENAIKADPRVYMLLSPSQRADQATIDIYCRSVDISRHAPSRFADPQKYFSPDNFEIRYGYLCKFGPFDQSYHKMIGNGPYNRSKLWVDFAEKINPEMKDQYSQIKRKVILAHTDDICKKIASCTEWSGWISDSSITGSHAYWIKEIREHCPKVEDRIYQSLIHGETNALLNAITSKGPFAQRLAREVLSNPENFPQLQSSHIQTIKETLKLRKDGPQFEQSAEFFEETSDLDRSRLKWLRTDVSSEQSTSPPDRSAQELTQEVSEFIVSHKNEIAQAIVDGKLSLENIVDAIGLKYDVDHLAQTEQASTYTADYDHESEQGEIHDCSSPGNRI
jgi:hypothetical protein